MEQVNHQCSKLLSGNLKRRELDCYTIVPIHTQLRYITYIPQKAQLDLDFPIKVEQVVLSGCYQDIGWFKRPEITERAKLNQLLKDLELDDLRHRQISELSGGQLQRVLVARALMSE